MVYFGGCGTSPVSRKRGDMKMSVVRRVVVLGRVVGCRRVRFGGKLVLQLK